MIHLVFLRFSGEISISNIYFGLDSYGFMPNGTFSFRADSSNCKNMIIGMLNPREIENVYREEFKTSLVCNYRMHFALMNSTSLNWSEMITSKIVLKPVIINCDSQQKKFVLNYNARNLDSFLDYRYIPSRMITIVFIIMFSLAFFFWIWNMVQFYSNITKLSILILFSLLFSLLNLIIYSQQLYEMSNNDNSKGFIFFHDIASIISRSILFIAVILCTSGWCLLHNELSPIFTLLTVFTSFSFFICSTLMSTIELGLWLFPMTLLTLAFVVGLLKLFAHSIDQAELLILAHMYSIYRAGIDPSSTPIYGRHKLYQRLQQFVFIYFLIIMIRAIISLFADADFWVLDLIDQIADFLLSIVFVIGFRVNPEIAEGYVEIGDEFISVDELRSFEIADESLQRQDLAQWNSGMQLPPPPKLKSNKVYETDNIISN